MAQNFDDLPELWEWKEIAEVFDVRDGTHDSPKYQDEGYPLITSKNLGVEGLHFKKVKFISEVDYEAINKRSKVDKGDMLFAMIGTIGNPTIIDIEPSFAIKNVSFIQTKVRFSYHAAP
ncbi:restriction endonuclease subunit S [Rubritalea tangerina]|uniref:restriction endonuclease subunit S n=1 Tax=Rubritalea tangerina TaxID=430798 RepID=UPI003619C237